MYAAVVLALAPWAMWKLFANLPPGFNGLAGVAAAGWASAGTLLVLDAVATPLAFMRKCACTLPRARWHTRALLKRPDARRYDWVPFPCPNGIFDDRWRDVLCGIFSAPLP